MRGKMQNGSMAGDTTITIHLRLFPPPSLHLCILVTTVLGNINAPTRRFLTYALV